MTAKAVKVDANNPFYDVAKYMSAIMHALPEVYGDAFYEELKEAFNNCLVAQVYSDYLTSRDYQVDYSVLLGTQGHYLWSRWIRLNRQEPSLWSKSGFDDELDDDDQ